MDQTESNVHDGEHDPEMKTSIPNNEDASVNQSSVGTDGLSTSESASEKRDIAKSECVQVSSEDNLPTSENCTEASSIDGSSTNQEQNGSNEEEAVKEEEWIQVLGHDKLKMKVLRAGDGVETRPVHGQLIAIRCCGTLNDGTTVDEHERLQLTLGDGDVIQAIDLCMALMQLNGIAQIVTDSKYAYGEQGREPDVPSNEQITYEIELLQVQDEPQVSTLTIQEKMNLGTAKRECGNTWYNRGDFVAAINSYTKSLKLLDANHIASESKEAIEDFIELRVKCYNNLAAAQLKAEAWDAGIKSCDSVIKLQPDNCKAHFRKGKCLMGKGDLEQAIQSLQEAIQIEPDSGLIHRELSKMVKKHKIQSQSTKDMYRRMLGTGDAKVDPTKRPYRWMPFLGGAGACLVVAVALAFHHR